MGEEDRFYNMMFGEWEIRETGVVCNNCDFPHMEINGCTKDGYPRYKCPSCKCKTDKDPKNIEFRRRIAAKFREQTK